MKTFSRITKLVIALVCLGTLIWMTRKAVENNPFPVEEVAPQVFSTSTQKIFIKTPMGFIQAVISSTTKDVEKGLSGQKDMPFDQGMLFVFSKPAAYGFWMKDMNFSLDFIWMTSDKTVIGVEKNVTPQTYPKVFYPNGEIRYVLELNSGAASNYGIATGTKLVF